MARAVIKGRFLSVAVKYLQERKRDGALFYYRRIPDSLRGHYKGRQFVRESLKTRDLAEAAKAIITKAKRDDALWASLRSSGVAVSVADDARQLVSLWGKKPGDGRHAADWPDDPHEDYLEGKYGKEYMDLRWATKPQGYADQLIAALLTPTENEALRLLYEGEAPSTHRLSDALKVYLEEHARSGDPKFVAYTQRAIKYATDAVGDLPLSQYSRAHAKEALAAFSNGRKTATAERLLAVVQAVVTKGIREFELPDVNPFRGLSVPNVRRDAKKVEPFTVEELHKIARACVDADDEIRHIVALQMDTGSRITEVVGLHSSDVFLGATVPYVWFRFKEGRSLKTPNSERSVPLLGMSLWAAERRPRDGWLFPRYASVQGIKGDHASAVVNKWLGKVTGTNKNSHSFRHAMRDRLLGADVRPDIAEAIMGHGGKSIAKGYGAGHSVEYLGERLALVAISPSAVAAAECTTKSVKSRV